MSVPPTRKISFVRRAWELIASKWIADVPENIACCEFNCRKLNCEQGEWETCGHRLSYMTAGLKPAEKAPQGHEVSDAGSTNIGDVAPRQ